MIQCQSLQQIAVTPQGNAQRSQRNAQRDDDIKAICSIGASPEAIAEYLQLDSKYVARRLHAFAWESKGTDRDRATNAVVEYRYLEGWARRLLSGRALRLGEATGPVIRGNIRQLVAMIDTMIDGDVDCSTMRRELDR